MARRRWMWIGGAAAALLALLIVILARPQAPFRFLDGRTPMFLPESLPVKDYFRRLGLDHSIYTFKADWRRLRAAADQELRKEGFKATDDDMPEHTRKTSLSNVVAYTKGDEKKFSLGVHAGTAAADMPEITSVNLWGDTRYRLDQNPRGSGFETDPGWVTVEIAGNGHRSPFHRFREWLGL